MDINTITNGVVNAATTAVQFVASTVLWAGRTVQSGFTNYIIPAVTATWNGFIAFATTAGGFLKENIQAGNIPVAIGLFIGAGVSFAIARNVDKDGATSNVFKFAGIAAALAGVAAVAFKAVALHAASIV